MATPSQPNNPSNPSSKIDITSLKEDLREVIRDQGDYNNLLKDSVRSLNSLDKAYTNISAKLNTLNNDTINVKKINQELSKLKQKEYIVEKSRNDLFKKASQSSKDLLDFAIKNGKSKQDTLDFLKAQGDLEAISLFSAEQALIYAKQQKNIGEEILYQEEEIAKTIGKTGALFGFLSQKLGIGKKLYGKMVEEARNGETTTKKWIIATSALVGALILARKAAGFIGEKLTEGLKGLTPEGGGVVSNLTGGLSGMIKNIPIVGGLLGGLVNGFSALLDVVVGVDDAIVKAGRNLGLSSTQARRLNRDFQDISFSSGNVFVTSKKLLESFSELAGQLEVNNRLSDEALQTNIMLKDFAGLELETRGKIVEVGKISGKSSEGVVKSVLAQVKGLEKATGVQFNYQKILKEVSSLSGVLGLNFSKYPAQLTKSYLTIKAMGMDMKQLESMADSFLDVESSIAKEMEAQVLTGRNINLNKARELFLNNDLAGAAAEINRQVGSSADFLKMNRIAAESFAQSLGMSRDSMADMLQKQELYSKLGAKGTENAREMYQLALKKYGTEKEMAAALGEQAYQSMVQASTQERLMNFIEKIKQSIVDFIERSNIIEKVEKFVKMLTNPDTIKGIIGTIKNAIADFIAFSGELLADVARFVSRLPFTDKAAWQARADIIQGTTAGMAGNIRAMGGNMGAAASIGDNAVKAQTAGSRTAAAQPAAQGFGGAQNINNNIVLTMDGRPVASTVQVLNTQSSNIDRNKTINPYPGIYTVG